jgi:benzoyl-CoA 2,3-epoxidase subunit B
MTVVSSFGVSYEIIGLGHFRGTFYMNLGRTSTCEAMNEAGITDPTAVEEIRKLGVVDLPTIQKKMHFHFSVTLDLFGSEVSTNAAAAYEAGIKGRFQETSLEDDHQLHGETYPVTKLEAGEFKVVQETALNALNARLRDDYVTDAQVGVDRWNKIIANAGIEYELKLPHIAFNRNVGEFSEFNVSPTGEVMDDKSWERAYQQFLPDNSDLAYINSLMIPESQPGKYATWIAPPARGIDRRPGDFEYVKL